MLLQWALDDGGLNQQPEWVKAEFCLLAKMKYNNNHPAVVGLTFQNPVYQALAHYWHPTEYACPAKTYCELFQNFYELPYVLNVLFGGTNDFHPFSRDNVLRFNHDVYFETDFGTNKLTDADDDISYILAELSKPHFTSVDDVLYYQCVDLTVSCGLALKCLSSDLSAEDKDFINTLDALTPTWGTYHAFLVKELYEVV